eukprot:TRINITY_DN10524_c0_g1_i1.p1 TRINITY_DN10524_c0_g1~~TRINITY_DN10524_c0_g1_i1.p1  ORF type:complete len:505 (+),score=54.28 TRINITY_DN10524_c0_g1_i1:311-1825(+)
MLGTPYWMAPEVMLQDGHGKPADIWSFGCTIIEMVTSKPPWSEYANVAALFYDIGGSDKIPDIPSTLSDDAKDFLSLCLVRDPKCRASVKQLLQHRWLRLEETSLKASISYTQHITASFILDHVFGILPPKVAYHIFKYLDFKTMGIVAQVCRHWKSTSYTKKLWKKYSLTEWKKLRNFSRYVHKNTNWREEFICRYKYVKRWQSECDLVLLAKVTHRHSKSVHCVQLLQSGNRIISGSEDKKIKLLERVKKKFRVACTLKGHMGTVYCLQTNPTETILFTGSGDRTIKLWDISSRRCFQTFDAHPSSVVSLRFHDSKLVSSSLGPEDNLSLWDVNNGEVHLVRKYRGHTNSVTTVSIDDYLIASGGFDKTIKVWDTRAADAVRTFTGHTQEISCLQFTDGIILSSCTDGTVKEWSVESQQCVSTYSVLRDKPVWTLNFDNMQQFITGGAKGLRLWDYHSEKLICDLKANTGGVLCLDWRNDLIVSGGKDKVIKIWHLQPRKLK